VRARGHSDLRSAAEKRMIPIRESAGAVTFAVKVHPRANKDAITGEVGDALKVALNAPPVDGKANDACVRFLAEILRVPRSSVTIAAGETNRNKLIRVAGMSAAQAEERLRIAETSEGGH
jgi:uncharacterized protein (TIGR00251 family)